VEVSSWRNGFSDGLALCALVHFHAPRELDYYALNKDDVQCNLGLVFDLLKRRWGIPQLVDPEDLKAGRADEDSVVALVATCKRELKTVPEPESLSQILPFASQQPGLFVFIRFVFFFFFVCVLRRSRSMGIQKAFETCFGKCKRRRSQSCR
jgi:hypothetical protein